MKKLAFVVATMIAFNASADVTPGDIFGGFFDAILDQIKKDNNDKDDNFLANNKVILKNSGDRIVLARLTLKDYGDSDSVQLPACNQSDNKRVDALRFRVDNADVYLENVRIVYQNGDKESVEVERTFDKDSASDWYQVVDGNRCIKSIRIQGRSLPKWGNPWGHNGNPWANSANHFPGHNPGWGPGPHHPGYPPPPPPPAKKAVLTFIGLKSSGNNF